MFGHVQRQVRGTVSQVRTTTKVGGGGGVVGPNGGVVHQTRSKEITTFSINDGAEVVAVELV